MAHVVCHKMRITSLVSNKRSIIWNKRFVFVDTHRCIVDKAKNNRIHFLIKSATTTESVLNPDVLYTIYYSKLTYISPLYMCIFFLVISRERFALIFQTFLFVSDFQLLERLKDKMNKILNWTKKICGHCLTFFRLNTRLVNNMKCPPLRKIEYYVPR